MHFPAITCLATPPSRLALVGALVFIATTASPAASQAVRYTGVARNGGFRGDATFDLTTLDPATGRVRATAQFSNGLSGDGEFEGTLRGGSIALRGPLVAGGTRYTFALQGKVDAGQRIDATYTLDVADGRGGRQEGTLSLAPGASPVRDGAATSAPAPRPASGSPGAIEPRMADAVRQSAPAEAVKKMTDEDFKYWKKPTPGGDRVPLTAFFRTWRLAVSGAVVTTENEATQTRTTTVSSGALAGRLVIRADGTYDWEGKRGRWRRTGNADYPLELVAADLGKDWGIGWDTRKHGTRGNILLVDGVEWLYAFPSR